jgi:hypothetical protein
MTASSDSAAPKREAVLWVASVSFVAVWTFGNEGFSEILDLIRDFVSVRN